MKLRYLSLALIIVAWTHAQTHWEDSLAILEQNGQDEAAIVYLEKLTEVESDDQLLQLLILEEYYLKEDQINFSIQENPLLDMQSTDGASGLSSTSTYLGAEITQGYHNTSQSQGDMNSIDTSTYLEIQLGREHYFQKEDLFHILDYSLQVSRENYKNFQIQSGSNNNLDNQSKTTYIGLSASYTLGNNLWYNSFILDWLPFEAQTDSENSIEVKNYYLTDWVAMQPHLGSGFSLPLSAYVSFANENSLTLGANAHVQGEWGRHRVTVGAQSLMSHLFEDSYEYFSFFLDSNSIGRTQFDNIIQAGESQLNGTGSNSTDQYHEYVDQFESALSSRGQMQESSRMHSYYYASVFSYQYIINSWKFKLSAELGQGGYFHAERYYTQQGHDSLSQVSHYLVETEEGIYGQFEKDGLRYYALANPQLSTPHYQEFQLEAEVNQDLNIDLSWGLNFGYNYREYQVHPVFLGYSPRGQGPNAEIETAEFGVSMDWKF